MSEKSTLADSIPDDKCFTIDDLAAEFKLGPQRTRQIIEKALKDKLVPRLIKTKGRQNLYTPQMIDALKDAMNKGKLGKFQNRGSKTLSKSSLKHAELIVTVPIFDEEIATLLKKKFQTEDGISKYLKLQLEETVKPILAKKRELQERYEREMSDLLRETTVTM